MQSIIFPLILFSNVGICEKENYNKFENFSIFLLGIQYSYIIIKRISYIIKKCIFDYIDCVPQPVCVLIRD